jgi:GntR family transcriptional regulator, rspAB operon transcriptional repressor
MTPADKDALAANLERGAAAVEADDRAAFYTLDVAFHQIMTARLGMARAHDVLESLRVHLERARRLTMSPPGRMRAALKEHAAIVAAIEAGDPSVAREAMRLHLDTTSALLESLARKQPGLFSLQADPPER